MKILLKQWWFWLIIALNTAVLVLALIDKNYLAAFWICAAVYWSVKSLLAEEYINDLRSDNLLLTLQLIETTRLLKEIGAEKEKQNVD